MCGRYEFSLEGNDKYIEELKKRIEKLNLDSFATGEIYPSNNCLIMIGKDNNKIDLDIKKWGISLNTLLINARIETLNEKKLYKNMHKCIILANGFYEWKNKEKYYIRKDSSVIYLAGLYDNNNEFVILTGQSKDEMANIHHRSPVIFDRQEMLNYLNNKQELYINNKDLYISKIA